MSLDLGNGMAGKLFRRSDLTRLLERIRSLGRTVEDTRLHVSLHKAAINVGSSSAAVLSLILEQELQVAVRSGEPVRLDSLRVDRRDVAALQRAGRSQELSRQSPSQA